MLTTQKKNSTPTMRIKHHFEGETVVTYDGQKLLIGKSCPFFPKNTHVYASDVETGRQGIIVSRDIPLKKGLRWFVED